VNVLRRRRAQGLVPLLFSAGLFLAYWIKLPYLYQNGRYMMPVLPFVVILGLVGFEWLITKGPAILRLDLSARVSNVLRVGVLGYAVIHFAYGTWQERVPYQDYCAYIGSRQVKAAQWIREHLPANAVVATHDVGALAYYSNRRIVDMVGLVSPGMIERIGDLGRLREFLIENGVTHLALLRNWFEVVNIQPLFQTSELTPEIMEVFSFDPDRVHFTSSQVAWLTSTGWQYLGRGDVNQGGAMLERAVTLDPKSSRAHHELGWAFVMTGQFERADAEFKEAVTLFPEYWLAHIARAQLSLRQNKTDEALDRLNNLLAMNPTMLAAHRMKAQIYTERGDTTKARLALEAFHRAAGQGESQ
jgi:tetratricopeptide (TPR) repeat protein